MLKTVFWDWNGTLIDDVRLTLDCENEQFAARGLPTISMERYLETFTFPISDYYRALGFDPALFADMNDEWLRLYEPRSAACRLREGAAETAKLFQARGLRQTILSASNHEVLLGQIARYPALSGLFSDIRGLSHSYANSKVQLALDYLRESGVRGEEAVFLGDTCHDAEVARASGCRCILIEGGHQGRSVLLRAGVPVVKNAAEAARLILPEASDGQS